MVIKCNSKGAANLSNFGLYLSCSQFCVFSYSCPFTLIVSLLLHCKKLKQKQSKKTAKPQTKPLPKTKKPQAPNSAILDMLDGAISTCVLLFHVFDLTIFQVNLLHKLSSLCVLLFRFAKAARQ